MNTILSRLDRDFPSLNTNNLPATVHAALGSLIKKRKVYYTGKGYFLVTPDSSTIPRLNPRYRKPAPRGTRENACQTEPPNLNGTSPAGINGCNGHNMNGHLYQMGWTANSNSPGHCLGSQPATPLQHHRQIGRLNSLSPMSLGAGHQPLLSPPGLDLSPRHSPSGVPSLAISNSSSSPTSSNHSHSSPDSSMKDIQEQSPKSQATLERSQSLRISKKSLRQMSKGGSLRLSKKDAMAITLEVEGEDNNNKSLESDERTSPSPKKMERKNSFLGRIFGRRKSNGSPKKEILTFSAQFPPPELEAARVHSMELQSAETQTPPHVRRKPSRPNNSLPISTSQVKSGPNGNFVVYERGGGRNPANRPLPQSPPLYNSQSPTYSTQTPTNLYNTQSQSPNLYGTPSEAYEGNIYSQPSHYGSKPPPPAYSSAPPYQPRSPPVSQRPSTVTTNSSPAPQRPSLVVSPNKSTGQKQVHFAATPRSNDGDSPRRDSPNQPKSPPVRRNATSRSSNSDSSNSGHSSLSGPSSLDSVLYDDTLIVIEKSNQELELRLDSSERGSINNRTQLTRNRVDTIHNNRHLDQEVIYEDTLSDSLSRSSSQSTLKPDSAPDHPSLSDLGSIADLSGKFQSLTARKLMAGLSISSIDTLLEVNAAAENGKIDKLDESTETVDFGVI